MRRPITAVAADTTRIAKTTPVRISASQNHGDANAGDQADTVDLTQIYAVWHRREARPNSQADCARMTVLESRNIHYAQPDGPLAAITDDREFDLVPDARRL